MPGFPSCSDLAEGSTGVGLTGLNRSTLSGGESSAKSMATVTVRLPSPENASLADLGDPARSEASAGTRATSVGEAFSWRL